MTQDPLSTLRQRMQRIGIEIEFVGNFPWIYLDRVNGIRIRQEDFTANHGFNIAWFGIRNEDKIKLAEDPKTIIALIRRYVTESRLAQMMKDDEASGLYQKPE
jgi:hypothetical protein